MCFIELVGNDALHEGMLHSLAHSTGIYFIAVEFWAIVEDLATCTCKMCVCVCVCEDMDKLLAEFNDAGKWRMIRADDVSWTEETRERVTWISADPASPLANADHLAPLIGPSTIITLIHCDSRHDDESHGQLQDVSLCSKPRCGESMQVVSTTAHAPYLQLTTSRSG